ncbi:MAG TPA: methionyl-tRNA formyltransferase [Dehalococcoidia bacterium]|nr:methionyl-tRNA formyltransferase [Dehalococcoidia bacterium]
MRIVLIGQAAFGKAVLERLLDRGEQIVAVYAPPDTSERPDALAQAARDRGIALEQPKRMRNPEVYEKYRTYYPDLNVMAFVTDFVPESILFHPPHETIQYHPSLLPRHRGPSAINWAIIHGDTKTGLTIFWVDKGLDTGPILLQKEVEIGPDDTVGSIYFDRLFPLGVDALIEAVDLVKAGTAPKIPQDESQATYESRCRDADGQIDWTKPAQQVYNLIRGCNPQPGASTTVNGQKLKIFDARLEPGAAGGEPGDVVESGDQGFAVAAPGGRIRVQRVQPEGAGKIAAGEFVRNTGLTVGTRLGA